MKIACLTPDLKRDYLCEATLEGLHKLDHQLVVSDPGNGSCVRALTDSEFVSQANRCDALLVFFGKVRGNKPVRRHLLDRVTLPREKIAYIDGAEWRADGWHTEKQVVASLTNPSARRGEPWIDEEMFKRCGHYFKRECYPQDLTRGIVPLPFALCDRHVIATDAKDIDVLCSFGQTRTGMRREAVEVVTRFKETMDTSLALNVVIRGNLSPAEYKDHLRRARVVVDAWGAGDTNDRFWEGVGAKACVLYQHYNVLMPDPFVDWEHAVSWSTTSELSSRLHRLVYSGDEVLEVGERGLEHAKLHHTAANRAERILQGLA